MVSRVERHLDIFDVDRLLEHAIEGVLAEPEAPFGHGPIMPRGARRAAEWSGTPDRGGRHP
jgi:hypothetical protein